MEQAVKALTEEQIAEFNGMIAESKESKVEPEELSKYITDGPFTPTERTGNFTEAYNFSLMETYPELEPLLHGNLEYWVINGRFTHKEAL